MTQFEFDGEIYNDDRMFVLYVCKGTVQDDGDLITTRVYHEKMPENYIWCVVTYRNTSQYKGYRVDHFDTENEAIAYSRHVEPGTPLVSLDGKSSNPAPTYEEFVIWKQKNNLQEYDYKKMFLSGGNNPVETFYKKKE